MRNAMIFVLLVFLVASCFGGWERNYGGSGSDYGNSMVVLDDGSFIVAGSTRSFGAGASDVYLVKADSLGDTLWTKTYGGTSYDRANFISKIPDGGFIVIGYTSSFGMPGENIYLLRTDENGDTLWAQTYVGDEGNCVQPTSDGGFILAGNFTHYNEGVVIKIDSFGVVLWDFIYGFGGWSQCELNAVVETFDGGYLACGSSEQSIGIPEKDEDDSIGVVLLKFNAEGDSLWSRYYYRYNEVTPISLILTPDSCFVLAGVHSNHMSHLGWYSGFYAKIDSIGNVLWGKEINSYVGESTFITGLSLIEDGGFGIVGIKEYSIPYLMKTNSFGDSLWTRTYETTSMKSPTSVSNTPDGGFLIAGHGNVGSETYDIVVLKVDSLGDMAISESPSARPEEIAISAYPNPFNSAVCITLSGGVGASNARPGQVGVQIFDITGRMVADLPDDNPVGSRPASTAGDARVASSTIIWQPDESLGSGVYLIRAKMGNKFVSKRVVYLK